MRTQTAAAKTSEYWLSAISELNGKSEGHADRRRLLVERKQRLSLDSQLGNDAAQQEIARLNKELADLTSSSEEIAFALAEAGVHLTAAQAKESAAAEQQRQQRCRVIAARVVAAAAAYDVAAQAMAAAAGKVKEELRELAGEEPRLTSSILFLPGVYTRAARHAGLRDTLDLMPSLLATTESLEGVAMGILGNWREK